MVFSGAFESGDRCLSFRTSDKPQFWSVRVRGQMLVCVCVSCVCVCVCVWVCACRVCVCGDRCLSFRTSDKPQAVWPQAQGPGVAVCPGCSCVCFEKEPQPLLRDIALCSDCVGCGGGGVLWWLWLWVCVCVCVYVSVWGRGGMCVSVCVSV